MLNDNINNKKMLKAVGLTSCFLSTMLVSMTSKAQNTPLNEVILSVTPEKCVALHKGQTCYLDVSFQWQAPKAGSYCLHNVTLDKRLNCWQSQRAGEFKLDFQSAEDHQFALRTLHSKADLAQAKVVVAWVYKSSKRAKSSWRLF